MLSKRVQLASSSNSLTGGDKIPLASSGPEDVYEYRAVCLGSFLRSTLGAHRASRAHESARVRCGGAWPLGRHRGHAGNVASGFAIPPFAHRHEAPMADARKVATGHVSGQPAQLMAPALRGSICPRQKPVFICDEQTVKKYINTFSPFKLFRGRVLEEGDDFEI